MFENSLSTPTPPPPSSPPHAKKIENLTAEEWLSRNKDLVTKWICDKTSADFRQSLVEKLVQNSPSGSAGLTARRPSVAADFQQLLMNSSPTKNSKLLHTKSQVDKKIFEGLNESDLFMELIRDISNELDIDVLCYKILVNVQLLTNADRGSLFLVREWNNGKHLIAKLFDVQQSGETDEQNRCALGNEIVEIPFGVGIAGTVAQTKEPINIKNAYEDPRFNCEIDMKTGYKTISILCMPICNYDDEVIGVAQLINKRNAEKSFTDHDAQIFQKYLAFCGIGIQNAQLFETSVLEFKRNQILLNLARSIFEEQNNLECLVTKIMTEAQELLNCDRCAVYLLDLNCCEANHLENFMDKSSSAANNDNASSKCGSTDAVAVVGLMKTKRTNASFHETDSFFSVVFELSLSNGCTQLKTSTVAEFENPILLKIANYAAFLGSSLNIGNVQNWLDMHKIERSEHDKIPKTLLNMPIMNGKKEQIGVAQLMSKANDEPFTESDVSLFEAFAIFCGLGIHKTQMYENACKLMAKQKVALECLSYHATASDDATKALVNQNVASAQFYNLYSFSFIDFHLNDDDTCKAVIKMFQECNLVQQFHIPYEVLCRWILSVKKNYRPVKYHNWRHALNVAQTMFAVVKTGKIDRFLSDLEILGLLVACLCHDLDHRGTNNAFQMKTESPLAILYTTSTMEHHHFDQCVMILNSDSNNIFQALSPENYRIVMQVVESAILSTDLAMFYKKRSKFLELIENGEFDWQAPEKKELLCGIMMTACDVAAISKPWEVQHKIAKLVADEFFEQGDLEKLKLNEQPIAMMDRERKDELPNMQVNFIDKICLPLYKILSETFPWVEPLYKGTLDNRKRWNELAEMVEMGLTWMDYDENETPFKTLKNKNVKSSEIDNVVIGTEKSSGNHLEANDSGRIMEKSPTKISITKSLKLKDKFRKRNCNIL